MVQEFPKVMLSTGGDAPGTKSRHCRRKVGQPAISASSGELRKSRPEYRPGVAMPLTPWGPTLEDPL